MEAGKQEVKRTVVDHIVRKASVNDLPSISCLVGAHKRELGFIRNITIVDSINRQEMFVCESEGKIIGIVRYHHRHDLQTTLYDIVVSPPQRSTGVGRLLFKALEEESSSLGKEVILLKCPIDLPANSFYSRMGFSQMGKEPGKLRELVIWRYGLLKES